MYADASLQAGTTTLTFTVIAMIMPAAWGAVTAPYNVFASEAAPAVIKQAVMPAPTSIGSCSPWRGCFSVTATDTAASYALRRVVVTATVATGVGAFVVPAAPFTITLAGGWVAAVSGAPVVNAPGRSVTQTFDWVAPPGVMGQAMVIQVKIPGDSATSFAWCVSAPARTSACHPRRSWAACRSANTDGPFIDMTVSYTLVEYPALGSGPAGAPLRAPRCEGARAGALPNIAPARSVRHALGARPGSAHPADDRRLHDDSSQDVVHRELRGDALRRR